MLFVAGCSGGVESEVVPPLEAVTGKVLIDGQPSAGVLSRSCQPKTTRGIPALVQLMRAVPLP